MLKPILISTLLLPLGVATVGASPVRAETVSKRISYADLDLSSEAGRKRLQSRISWTVRGLCGSRDLSSDPVVYRQVHKCEREAHESTRQQVASAIAQAEGKRQRLASR